MLFVRLIKWIFLTKSRLRLNVTNCHCAHPFPKIKHNPKPIDSENRQGKFQHVDTGRETAEKQCEQQFPPSSGSADDLFSNSKTFQISSKSRQEESFAKQNLGNGRTGSPYRDRSNEAKSRVQFMGKRHTANYSTFNHARRMVAVFLEKFQTGESLFPLADFFTFGTPTFGILTRMLSSLVADGDGGGTQFSEDVVKSTTGSMGDVLVESFLPIFCVWALRLLILDHD
ncbi:hypothetical protein RvY_18661-1 [Ramazzottius varieornatus]|uniref:Uncharacterized protein n=1 Tax=Ramazzottius varieornatus TaxID=947166 RepID=A0A1D1W6L6_RAMVA|nr:hypothetical protein RvY_18661-1 [Ramazzottius varieornatus]